MITKSVMVNQIVEVSVDESKFTDEFMREFREVFYSFHTIDEHICHLGQLRAREMAYPDSFVEGYGDLREMGVTMRVIGIDVEVYEG